MKTKISISHSYRGVLILLLIITASTSSIKAQKVIDQGTLTYDISYDLNEDQKKVIDVENLPSVSKVKFSGPLSKVEIDMGLASLKMIVDGPGRAAILLVDAPMIQKQYATKFNKEDLDRQGGNLSFKNFKAPGEKMKIAGYDAEKYTYQDNKEENYEVWIAPQLKMSAGAILPEFAALKGAPVKYVSIQYGIKNILTLKSLTEEKTGPFSMAIPQGYEVKTPQEMDAMFKMLNGTN